MPHLKKVVIHNHHFCWVLISNLMMKLSFCQFAVKNIHAKLLGMMHLSPCKVMENVASDACQGGKNFYSFWRWPGWPSVSKNKNKVAIIHLNLLQFLWLERLLKFLRKWTRWNHLSLWCVMQHNESVQKTITGRGLPRGLVVLLDITMTLHQI